MLINDGSQGAAAARRMALTQEAKSLGVPLLGSQRTPAATRCM